MKVVSASFSLLFPKLFQNKNIFLCFWRLERTFLCRKLKSNGFCWFKMFSQLHTWSLMSRGEDTWSNFSERIQFFFFKRILASKTSPKEAVKHPLTVDEQNKSEPRTRPPKDLWLKSESEKERESEWERERERERIISKTKRVSRNFYQTKGTFLLSLLAQPQGIKVN